MKIKLILTAFAFAIASFSFAQTDQAMSADDQIKKQSTQLTEQMTSFLDLDENQVKRMEGLNLSLMKKKAELKGMDLSESEMAEKVSAFEARHNATIQQVLSEEQYKKFQAKYADVKMTKKDKVKK
ncbi:MAG: hypothetical protein ACI9CP_001165 [Cryomorphaceae bacterium]|jgi:hypothetical protein